MHDCIFSEMFVTYQMLLTAIHYLFFLIIFMPAEFFRAAAVMSQSGEKGKVSVEVPHVNITVTLSRRQGFLIK